MSGRVEADEDEEMEEDLYAGKPRTQVMRLRKTVKCSAQCHGRTSFSAKVVFTNRGGGELPTEVSVVSKD